MPALAITLVFAYILINADVAIFEFLSNFVKDFRRFPTKIIGEALNILLGIITLSLAASDPLIEAIFPLIKAIISFITGMQIPDSARPSEPMSLMSAIRYVLVFVTFSITVVAIGF